MTWTCLFITLSSLCALSTAAFPEQGRWEFNVNQDKKITGVIKGLYENTGLYIKVLCDSPSKQIEIDISYVIRQARCYQETLDPDNQSLLEALHHTPTMYWPSDGEDKPQFVNYHESKKQTHTCDHSIVLQVEPTSKLSSQPPIVPTSNAETNATIPAKSTAQSAEAVTDHPSTTNKVSGSSDKSVVKRDAKTGDNEAPEDVAAKTTSKEKSATSNHTVVPNDVSDPQFLITSEGIFIVTVKVESKNLENFTASVELELKGAYGYLSAVDWPLLPFYGSMCIIYFIYGVAWLVVLAMQWRDLLRIQFWIGGVIFLGMIEKAVFYAEYQSVNSTGISVQGAVLFAELVSCLKRTLARMLVIIVSLGFGIVKPRLGPMLHRVVGVGGLYFLLCSLEAFLRVMRPKNDPSKTLMLAEVPLAIIDTAICWWIFSNLVQTTRTLRLRRNVVKLSLYRHFTNTLIFACIASVAFMVWVYKAHNLPKCVADWKELWVDDAYWHLLFSVVLLVIMILWRPTNNNQRYAFTPLIDAADDDVDDSVMNDAFDGMKMRGNKTPNVTGTPKEKEPLKNAEDDLAWVEDNIPSSIADSALPSLLDSDEEIMNTRFEISKMDYSPDVSFGTMFELCKLTQLKNKNNPQAPELGV